MAMRGLFLASVLFVAWVAVTAFAYADGPLNSKPLSTGGIADLVTADAYLQDLASTLPGASPLPWSSLKFSPLQKIDADCCKVCRKGKACGNSCISKTKTCTKAPGCACDGN